MKITLDHNCILDLVLRSEHASDVEALVRDSRHQCFVVEIGASELRERGVRPDSYRRFEELLGAAGIAHLPRLTPMLIFDVTFWNRCEWGTEQTIELARDIEVVLFGECGKPPPGGLDSPDGRRWLNRLCDIHTMWCHIKHGNDVFLTRDNNFHKASKVAALVALGARRISTPKDLKLQSTSPSVGSPAD